MNAGKLGRITQGAPDHIDPVRLNHLLGFPCPVYGAFPVHSLRVGLLQIPYETSYLSHF